MDAATLEMPAAAAPPKLDSGRVRDIVLVRVAFAGKALNREALAKELAPLGAHLVTASDWRQMIEKDLAALADAGLVEIKTSSVAVTVAGAKRAAMVLGGKGNPPRSWTEARDIRLVAKALGVENEAATRLKALAKPDGLRAALVMKAFKLRIRGVASPTKLRQALAQVALSRAFGDQMKTGAPSKSGLSTKAARVLAGQLANKPQDFRTDSRLIGALASEFVGANTAEFSALQLAILRGYVTKGSVPASLPPPKRKARIAVRSKPDASPKQEIALQPASKPVAASSQHALQRAPHGAPARIVRPDLAGFVADVRRHAGDVAEGWPGNRKVFISRLWRTVSARRPEWALTEIEFKCMLAEAHRAGQIMLANADLKDERNLKDVQDSALAYKNAVFHFVRVDE
jgi:hypothetical protein